MFECPGAKAYIEYGLVISIKTDKISFQSVPHAQAYNAGTLRKGTLENPFNAVDLPTSAVEQVKEQPTPGVNETAPIHLVHLLHSESHGQRWTVLAQSRDVRRTERELRWRSCRNNFFATGAYNAESVGFFWLPEADTFSGGRPGHD